MQRVNNLFPKITSFENVLSASKKARKGKRFKSSTALFELNLEKNIQKIMVQLSEKTWQPGIYNDFFIYDPKKRLISAAPYYDRVIHHALINVIEPIIGRSFIYDTYACIKGKGTHKAVERYREFIKHNRYVLKCDIKSYFQNIDHDILYKMVERKIKCRDTLWLIKKVIDSRESRENFTYFSGDNLFTPFERKRGIPIGNLTSQFFANLYLNDFDHFVKERLKIKHYIRYCDDFVLFGNSKARLNEVKMNVIEYLEKPRLKLHDNKSRVYRVNEGVDFLGYRIYPDYMKVRKSIVKRYRRKLGLMAYAYNKGKLSLEEVNMSIQSWIGHVKHAASYRLREDMFAGAVFARH